MPSLARATAVNGNLPRSICGAAPPDSMEDVCEAAKKRAEPYNKVVGELPDMRKEAVVLIKHAVGDNRRAYALVNNRLEGNAPLTVQALTDLLR